MNTITHIEKDIDTHKNENLDNIGKLTNFFPIHKYDLYLNIYHNINIEKIVYHT